MSRHEGSEPFGDVATAIELIGKGLSLGAVCTELRMDESKLTWLLRTNGHDRIVSHGKGGVKRQDGFTANRGGRATKA